LTLMICSDTFSISSLRVWDICGMGVSVSGVSPDRVLIGNTYRHVKAEFLHVSFGTSLARFT
jgi:hypothetical protein